VPRLVDDQGNDILEDGVNGEVLVRGSSLMMEYVGNPAATADVVASGWLRTGDIAYVRGGRWHVVDRAKVFSSLESIRLLILDTGIDLER